MRSVPLTVLNLNATLLMKLMHESDDNYHPTKPNSSIMIV